MSGFNLDVLSDEQVDELVAGCRALRALRERYLNPPNNASQNVSQNVSDDSSNNVFNASAAAGDSLSDDDPRDQPPARTAR